MINVFGNDVPPHSGCDPAQLRKLVLGRLTVRRDPGCPAFVYYHVKAFGARRFWLVGCTSVYPTTSISPAALLLSSEGIDSVGAYHDPNSGYDHFIGR